MIDPDCVFCLKIAAGDYDQLYADPHGERDVVVFTPLHPLVPGHTLVVPVRHAADAAADPLGAAAAMRVAALHAQWYLSANIITSRGAAATQTVFHTHLHVVPRAPDDGLMLPWTGQQR